MTAARKQSLPTRASVQPAGPDGPARSDELQAVLAGLYRKHLSLRPPTPYILEHQQPACVANQVRTFHWYRPYLPESGAILDWGCNHGPDACLLRAWYGDRLDLHACDFVERDEFGVFHDFSRCEYRQLTDTVRLPYHSGTLDAVIASGVLEHTAMDYESLKELHRVLKPDGVLVVSYLPNRLSLREWVQRVVRRKDFHRRLYGVSEATQLLKRSGFYPATVRYHTFFWERLVERVGLGRWRDPLAGALATLLPFQVISSTLCCVAHKVTVM